MSGRMFDRQWKIVLELVNMDETGNYTVIRSKELRELKVTFNIRNTLLGDPSLGSFQIYNVNTETASMLTSRSCIFTFKTAYGGVSESAWKTLFSGEITNAYPIRQGTDVAHNVWVRDSSTLLRYLVDIPSIKVETPRKDLLTKLKSEIAGLKGYKYIGDAESILNGSDPVKDYTFGNLVSEELTDILAPIGLSWHCRFGFIHIVKSDGIEDPTDSENAIDINSQTGLLTRPYIDYTGINFTHLLQPDLFPDTVIAVEPNTVQYRLGNEFYVQPDYEKWVARGKFRIMEVNHRGDTRGDRWQTDVKCFYRKNE